MFKICFFVPIDSAEIVKEAMFLAGAGKIGHYEYCCFESRGFGQFKPLIGAHPAIGNVGVLEKVEELKVEMICSEDKIRDAIAQMKLVHPYEEVAYEVYKLENF